MFEGDSVFVDIETNGGNGPRGRVIEVAAIKVTHGEIVDTFRSLVNPGSSVPYWITQLTGITSSELVDAPYFEDIAAQLYDFMQGSIFVAHNVLFDYSFLKREFAAAGYKFQPKLFCTIKMSRALWPEHRGHSLEKIITRHAITVSSRHRAYDDAKAMYDFVKLTIAAKGYDAFRANIAAQLRTKSLQPIFNRQLRRKTMQSIFLRDYDPDGYETIQIKNTDLYEHQNLDNVYGVYTTKSQAKSRLEAAAKTFGLCPKLLGLEKASGACFRYQLGLCRGACIGKEPPETYNARVDLALEHSKIESWPFKSAVAVRISATRSIIVDQWVVKSVVEYVFDEPIITPFEGGFDIDTYRILRGYIRQHPEAVSLFDAMET